MQRAITGRFTDQDGNEGAQQNARAIPNGHAADDEQKLVGDDDRTAQVSADDSDMGHWHSHKEQQLCEMILSSVW
jgi:hypothetical protein